MTTTINETTHFILKPSDIEALLICASKEQVRYYLNGIYIEQQTDTPAFLIVATDGHRLLQVLPNAEWHIDPAKKDDVNSPILPSDALANIVKMAKAYQKTHKILQNLVRIAIERPKREAKSAMWEPLSGTVGLWDDESFATTSESINFKIMLVDGSFPDFRRVIPERVKRPLESNEIGISANGNYLADFAKVAKLLDGAKHGGFTITQTLPNDPMLIHGEKGAAGRWTGVLMPMRLDR